MKLATEPSANVTVTVISDDTDAATVSPSALTFTTSNYDTDQTVTVTGVDDNDGNDESVTVTNRSVGGGYSESATVSVTVEDDDRGLTLTPTSVTVDEGSTETYTVQLATQPSTDVTVAVTRVAGGDTDLTFAPSALTFSTTNWNTAQTVTASAAEDDGDGLDGTATFKERGLCDRELTVKAHRALSDGNYELV